jgi:tRNA A37 threonylcarbamoyladenosine synthetase subunit TsaC/SUA5/YrdC
MSVSLILPGQSQPMLDPYDIRETLEHEVDLVIDGGYCGLDPTTVIDLSGDEPVLIRKGVGDTEPFGL